MQYQYKVNKRYARGTDADCAAFKDLNDATFFIERKMEDDERLSVKVIYSLFEFNELLKEYDPNKLASSSSGKTTQSSQGTSSTASFKPTPFNTTPRPSGTPQKWNKDDDEDEKK